MRRVPDVRPPALRPAAVLPGPAPRRGPVTVALAGAEFGWGSSGKLSAVLSALRERARLPLRFVGLASGLGRPLLAEHSVEHWYDLPDAAADRRAAVGRIVRSHGVRAAVVVLDGAIATALQAAGVPTVFVDSLPFLWTEGDRAALPLDATVYCAQQCVGLPPECEGILASVASLRWVEAVIGTPPAGSTGTPGTPGTRTWRKALVSLGGLGAPRLPDRTAYPRVVVPAVLDALAEHGVQEAHLAGNLPAGLLGGLVERPPAGLRVTAGPLPHSAFLSELTRCDVLLASPGLTTLLEAGRLGVPTVCLPPQNLSQIFNGRFHSRAVGVDVRVVWPENVFREEEALGLRAKGEDHALELIYGGIGRVAARADGTPGAAGLRAAVLAAVRRAAGGADWGALTAAVGTGGAAQVAEALLAIAGPTPARGA
ncbi:hydroxymethylcytosylglucuronate/cytosylglucuronate synthase [Streptomyces sp. SCA3-4]|uniref:hydroxymethylcytosylglucuronate/cytosylglucurona te synthase n=1 Tax=Streptomyces sichuanensis TaxID=2871810 RepID=UPI001CE29401|nr:hydroxymethylcytosylglucuronate/cytosylglucuronate synthase [Streptomyces sichuanensis]MCA6091279.1 hydroxymethylcytosylglucuronate/cytosylglucuronate synthase [Streptomyces sichuanensis]